MPPSTPWDAERVVDVGRATELVGRAVPELRGKPVSPLSTGWDHTVHLVDGEWVVRFPRRAVALPGFRRELAVLPVLAPLLPLPVPVPVWTATDDHPADPWPFAGSRFLPGEELARAGLPDEDRAAVGVAVGGFLRALHAPATATAVGDLPFDPMRRADPAAWARETRGHLEELARTGASVPVDRAARLLDAGARLGPATARPVVVHGDLHVRHVLVGDGAATAVIDWGDVCLADPAVDLSLAFAGFTGASRAAFLAAYGPVDAERELRARCLALRLGAFLARYAAASGADGLLRESLASLARALDR